MDEPQNFHASDKKPVCRQIPPLEEKRTGEIDFLLIIASAKG